MLAPFLLLLSRHLAVRGRQSVATPTVFLISWFALLFLGVAAVNSVGVLPEAVVASLVQLDTALLATAMAALGLRTRINAIGQAGCAPDGASDNALRLSQHRRLYSK